MPKKDECCDDGMPPGLAWRTAVSIVVGIGWLIFLVLFLFFYAQDFSVYQNLAILIVSVLAVGAILGPMWAYWGLRTSHAWKKRVVERKSKRTRR